MRQTSNADKLACIVLTASILTLATDADPSPTLITGTPRDSALIPNPSLAAGNFRRNFQQNAFLIPPAHWSDFKGRIASIENAVALEGIDAPMTLPL